MQSSMKLSNNKSHFFYSKGILYVTDYLTKHLIGLPLSDGELSWGAGVTQETRQN